MAGDHKMTRLLACSEEELKTYKGLDLGPTFVHPNYRHNPINGDTSASYNKPASVMHFSQSSNYTEEFLLFIDADMILWPHKPIDLHKLGARKGVVVSERVSYMIGDTLTWERHLGRIDHPPSSQASAPNQPRIHPESAPNQPLISPSSAPHRPLISPSSTPHQPLINPQSNPNQTPNQPLINPRNEEWTR